MTTHVAGKHVPIRNQKHIRHANVFFYTWASTQLIHPCHKPDNVVVPILSLHRHKHSFRVHKEIHSE